MLQSNWTNPFTNLDLGQYFMGAVGSWHCQISPKIYFKRRTLAWLHTLAFVRRDLLTMRKDSMVFEKNLKTFTEIWVKKAYKAGDKQVLLKADRNLFAKMILIGQTRKLWIWRIYSPSAWDQYHGPWQLLLARWEKQLRVLWEKSSWRTSHQWNPA